MAFSRQGERKNPFKGRWHSGLQAPNYRAEQRSGRHEKDCAKQQFYAVFIFSCKKQGIATAGCVPIATRGCFATVGCVQLQPIDALQLPVGFPLQPVDALQLWVGFDCNPWMHYNRRLCSAKKRRDGQTIPSHFQPAFSRRRMRLCVRVCTPSPSPRTRPAGRFP